MTRRPSAVTTSLGLTGLLVAAAYAWHREQTAAQPGIDFVQFHLTGRHVAGGDDPRVWSPDVRTTILDNAWQRSLEESQDSRLRRAVTFRHQRSWETYSSPFLYAVFGAPTATSGTPRAENRVETVAAFSGEQYDRALAWFHVMCLFSTVIGVLAFGRVLQIPKLAMLLGAAMLLAYSPLRSDQNVANVNQIQFGMVGILAWLLERASRLSLGQQEVPTGTVGALWVFVAGVWLGLCLAFKPSLLWCGVMWFGVMMAEMVRPGFAGRGRPSVGEPGSVRRPATGVARLAIAVLGGLVGGLMAVGFSAIWFPLHCWLEWIGAVRSLPDEIIRTDMGNFSPTYFVRMLGVPSWLTRLFGPLIGCIVLVVAWRQTMTGMTAQQSRRSRSSPDLARWLAIGCQIQLLTSNLVWYHYFVLSLPAILVAARDAWDMQFLTERIVFGLTLLWCMVLLGVQPLDGWLNSSSTEHMLRCGIANILLLGMLLLLPTVAARIQPARIS